MRNFFRMRWWCKIFFGREGSAKVFSGGRVVEIFSCGAGVKIVLEVWSGWREGGRCKIFFL